MTTHEGLNVDDRLGRLVRQMSYVAPPVDVHDRLLGMFASLADATPMRRRIGAVLLGSGTPGLAAAGARGASVSQAVFTSDVADISVQIKSVAGQVRLDGMVLPVSGDEGQVVVRLEREGDSPVSVQTNQFGEFRFVAARGGAVHLVVEIDGVDVAAGPIEVAA